MRNIDDILTEIMKKENLNDQDIFFENSIDNNLGRFCKKNKIHDTMAQTSHRKSFLYHGKTWKCDRLSKELCTRQTRQWLFFCIGKLP